MESWKNAMVDKRPIVDALIGLLAGSLREKETQENREYVKLLIRAVAFLAEGGLAFRGHDESEDSLRPGNFRRLISFMAALNHEFKATL